MIDINTVDIKHYYISLIDIMVGLSVEEKMMYQKLSVEQVEDMYRLIYLEVNDEIISRSEVKCI